MLEQDWDLQVAIFEKLVGVPKLDEKAITAWLYRLIRATAARLTTFPVYATSRKGSFLTRMAGQRVRLMDVLGRRFEGFAAPYKVDCLLVLFQIEQFVVHAAAAHDDAETAAGVAEIVAQLLRRLPPAQE